MAASSTRFVIDCGIGIAPFSAAGFIRAKRQHMTKRSLAMMCAAALLLAAPARAQEVSNAEGSSKGPGTEQVPPYPLPSGHLQPGWEVGAEVGAGIGAGIGARAGYSFEPGIYL